MRMLEAVNPGSLEGTDFVVHIDLNNDGSFDGQKTISNGSYLKGDIDGNAVVDIRDAILALRVLSGKVPGGISVYREAGVDSDGRVGLGETIFILQRIAEIRAQSFSLDVDV